MIFLAISATLFVAAMRLISGQQRRAEFSYGVQEFSSELRDMINDVSTGYYEYNRNFSCRATGSSDATNPGPILITSVAAEQGTNQDCIFIGRVIQFAPSDAGGSANTFYRVYTVAGRRTVTDGTIPREVVTLKEAKPQALSPRSTAPGIPDLTSTHAIPNGLIVKWVHVNGASVGAVGFFTNFAKYDANSNLLETEARNVDVIPIDGTVLGQTKATAADKISTNPDTWTANPPNGIQVCLENGGGDGHVIIDIASNQRALAADLDIRGRGCP
jgi:hypothetical protein